MKGRTAYQGCNSPGGPLACKPQVPAIPSYLPMTILRRSPVNPDHAPVQLSGAGNVTARISLCGAGRTLIRKMTGTITVPVDHAEQRLPIPLFTISFYCITDKVATNTHRQFSTLCRHMPLVSISYGALLRICLII